MKTPIELPIQPLRRTHLNPPQPMHTPHEELVAAIVGRIRGHDWRPAHSPVAFAYDMGVFLDEVQAAELEARDIVRRRDPLDPHASELQREASLAFCLIRAEARARRFDLAADRFVDSGDPVDAYRRALAEASAEMGGAVELEETARAAALLLRAIAALDAGLKVAPAALASVARLCAAIVKLPNEVT